MSFPAEISACADCGEEFYTYEQSLAHSRAAATAVREAQGLLSPERIRAARMRMGMTLPQFEHAMGVGAKTVGRWERGTVAPSRAANGMLWLAERHPDVFLEYARERIDVGATAPRDAAVIATIFQAPSAASRPFVLLTDPTKSGRLTLRTGDKESRTALTPYSARVTV